MGGEGGGGREIKVKGLLSLSTQRGVTYDAERGRRGGGGGGGREIKVKGLLSLSTQRGVTYDAERGRGGGGWRERDQTEGLAVSVKTAWCDV